MPPAPLPPLPHKPLTKKKRFFLRILPPLFPGRKNFFFFYLMIFKIEKSGGIDTPFFPTSFFPSPSIKLNIFNLVTTKTHAHTLPS